MMNPLRTGLLPTLREMGGDIETLDKRLEGGGGRGLEGARGHARGGVDVPAAPAPSMIDEYPILAVAAAFASGSTRMRGLSELQGQGERSSGRGCRRAQGGRGRLHH